MSRPRKVQSTRGVFWGAVSEGASTEVAAAAAGVSAGTGRRWFRDAGGMSPVGVSARSGRYLSLAQREEIMVGLAQGRSVRSIAAAIGRSPSTVSREVRRNRGRRHPSHYRSTLAQAKAEERARRPKTAKLAGNRRLRQVVQQRLEEGWSPEQIALRLQRDYPDDPTMRVCHETIYQSLYVQGRGALRRELARCLRTGRALRKPRRRSDARRTRIKDMVMISERPAEVADRAVPGHWEGDLIMGANNASAVGTLVERTTRFTLLLHLPDGHGADQVRDAMLAKISQLPAQLWRSLTWDQGIEMAKHREITFAADLPVYFCDPASPWQRGSNENTNGLLRQYLPKGSDLSVHTEADLDTIAARLNSRPRKTLDIDTPAEALNELLSSPFQ